MTRPETLWLVEELSDAFGDYTCYWYCEPPEKGVTYRVTKQVWDTDGLERYIYEIQEIR
jgi:hypothetical protein